MGIKGEAVMPHPFFICAFIVRTNHRVVDSDEPHVRIDDNVNSACSLQDGVKPLTMRSVCQKGGA